MGKLKPYKKEIIETYLQDTSRSASSIASGLYEKYKQPDCNYESFSRRVRRLIAKEKLKINPSGHEALLQECNDAGIPIDSVNYYWYKSQKMSINAKNTSETAGILDAVKDIIYSYQLTEFPKPVRDSKRYDKAITLILSDMHVGLEPNPNGTSLFNYEYNAEIFNENLDKAYNSVLEKYESHGKFDLLVIDDLGDGLDGWDGETTRKGHKLDQNMTNHEQFTTFVNGKLRLIENFIKADIAKKIYVRNVANDNHAGSFSHIANTAIQMILNRVYDSTHVNFHILEKFMEHFTYGDHTFILTHGKDNKHMFKGLPLILNDRTIKFINDYIDHYEINSKYIHVAKGDLHSIGYQKTKKFDYYNFMAFSPPSAWVQHNFGDAYCGYSIQVIPKYSNEISHSNYFFELKKNIKKIA